MEGVMNVLMVTQWMFIMAASADVAQFEAVEEWNLWKEEHGKKYLTYKEELRKHMVWLSNRKYIDEHNAKADRFGYSLSINQFGDMSTEEFNTEHVCYQPRNDTQTSSKEFVRQNYMIIPETVDWRTKNAVTEVKNQGLCRSCYSFSTTGALEGAHSLAHDKLVSLSEQNLLDCSVPYGNHGCNGGNMHDAFQYVIDNEGVDTEESYPYIGKQGECQFKKDTVGATQTGVVTISSGNELDLQAATATAGPVSIAVDATSNAFRFYAGGVFDEPNCSTSKLTHTMLMIGYGNFKGKDYWLVKNSWGTSWGIDGYIMMARNKSNQCGIASAASFPTL